MKNIPTKLYIDSEYHIKMNNTSLIKTRQTFNLFSRHKPKTFKLNRFKQLYIRNELAGVIKRQHCRLHAALYLLQQTTSAVTFIETILYLCTFNGIAHYPLCAPGDDISKENINWCYLFQSQHYYVDRGNFLSRLRILSYAMYSVEILRLI